MKTHYLDLRPGAEKPKVQASDLVEVNGELDKYLFKGSEMLACAAMHRALVLLGCLSPKLKTEQELSAYYGWDTNTSGICVEAADRLNMI